MSSNPFMQVYVADYTADTQHLSCEEDGAYWRLLRAMWRAGGQLPMDDRKLAIICGLSASGWKRVKTSIVALFDVSEGSYTQKRLAKELQKAREKSSKRSEAGKLGGASTALKNKEPDPANAAAMPQHLPELEPELEIESPISPSGEIAPRGAKRTRRKNLDHFVPEGWQPKDVHGAKAKALGLTSSQAGHELEVFRNHEFPKPHSDWDRAFHNWLLRAAKGITNGAGSPTGRTRWSLGRERKTTAYQQGLVDFVNRGGGRE